MDSSLRKEDVAESSLQKMAGGGSRSVLQLALDQAVARHMRLCGEKK